MSKLCFANYCANYFGVLYMFKLKYSRWDIYFQEGHAHRIKVIL